MVKKKSSVENKKEKKLKTEEARLSEPIAVYQIRTDEYLHTKTEVSIPRPSKYSRMNITDHDKESEKGTYWWKVAGIREIHPYFAQFQSYKRHRCPYCKFQNIYLDSVKHHLQYTHKRGHSQVYPNEPNTWYDTMTDKDFKDWEKALSR